jgi:hypothetical protein
MAGTRLVQRNILGRASGGNGSRFSECGLSQATTIRLLTLIPGLKSSRLIPKARCTGRGQSAKGRDFHSWLDFVDAVKGADDFSRQGSAIGPSMLFMVIEDFKDGDPNPIRERFVRDGRMLPDGVIYHASWVDPANSRCFQVMEAKDRDALQGVGQLLGRSG